MLCTNDNWMPKLQMRRTNCVCNTEWDRKYIVSSPHFPSQPDQSDTIQAGTLQDSLPEGGSHSSSSGGFSDPPHLYENIRID